MIRTHYQYNPISQLGLLKKIEVSRSQAIVPYLFFSRYLSGETSNQKTESSQIAKAYDLQAGTFSLRLHGKIPYMAWKEVQQLLSSSGASWSPKERAWKGFSNPVSSDALAKAEDYLIDVLSNIEEYSQEEQDKLEEKWIQAEQNFLSKSYPAEMEKVNQGLQNSSVDLVNHVNSDGVAEQFIEKILDLATSFLPPGLNKKRYLALLKQALTNLDKLLELDSKSVERAAYTASALGLEPDSYSQEGFFIPFKNKLHFVIGYRGLMALSCRSEDVLFFDARCVYKQDRFELVPPPQSRLNHIPHEEVEERGPMTQVYAIRVLKSGINDIYVLNARDIKKYRQMSKSSSSKSSPWQMWPEEMALKSAVKGLTKKTELSSNAQPSGQK